MADERLGQARRFATMFSDLARVGRHATTFLAFALARVPSFPDVRAGWAMSRPVLVLNILMAGLSVFFLVRIADAVFRPGPALPLRVASSPAPVNVAVADSSRSRTSYDLIPARNLFHPDRAQPKRSDALGALPVAPALLLYGVVWSEENPLAYVEDPTSKKIFGYKTGDAMAGGYIERIEMDRIIIHRQDGPLEVMLRAPNKPRPVAAATAPTEAAATPSAPQPAPTVDGVSPGIPRGIVRRNRD